MKPNIEQSKYSKGIAEAEQQIAFFKERKRANGQYLAQKSENVAASYQLGYKYLFTLNGAAAVAMITIITSYKEKLESLCTVYAVIAFVIGCIFSLMAIHYYIKWQLLDEQLQKIDNSSIDNLIAHEEMKIFLYQGNVAPHHLPTDKNIKQNSQLQKKIKKKIEKKKQKSMNWLYGSFGAFVFGIGLAVYPFLPITSVKLEKQIIICDSSYPECNRILAAPSATKPN